MLKRSIPCRARDVWLHQTLAHTGSPDRPRSNVLVDSISSWGCPRKCRPIYSYPSFQLRIGRRQRIERGALTLTMSQVCKALQKGKSPPKCPSSSRYLTHSPVSCSVLHCIIPFDNVNASILRNSYSLTLGTISSKRLVNIGVLQVLVESARQAPTGGLQSTSPHRPSHWKM